MATAVTQIELFTNLSSVITQLRYGCTENNRNLIKKTIQDLNQINYKYPIVTNQIKAVLLVNQCCALIPPEDFELSSACCQLIKTLITLQNIVIEGRTLTIAVTWCLKALQMDDEVNIEVLGALHALLKLDKSQDFIMDIVGNRNLCELSENGSSFVTVTALKCLESVLIPSQDIKSSNTNYNKEYKICYEIFVKHLSNCRNIPTSSSGIQIFTICLQGLQNISLQHPTIITDSLGTILGIIKSYMLFNVEGIEFSPVQKLLPSTLTLPEPSILNSVEKKGGKVVKQRKQRTPAVENKRRDSGDENVLSNYTNFTATTPIELPGFSNNTQLKTSDSDFSDTESNENLSKIAAKVRQAALNLFMHVIKVTQKNIMFSYWTNFIPENTSSNKHTLIACILKDPTPRGRLAALNALLLLLTSSKLYLKQAEKRENLSFTPFSVIIGIMLDELHKCLSVALKEYSIPILIQILKCYAALIQATPYHKLQSGLITKAITSVKPFIYHKDSSVQVTALIALGCCIASEPQIHETKDTLQPENWLIERCLLNLNVKNHKIIDNNTPTAVKMESFQIISVISLNYFEAFLIPYLEQINLALNTALNDKYTDVRFHAGRTLNFIGQAINQYLTNNSMNEDFVKFWETILNGSLIELLQCEQYPILRTVGCDCLSSIGKYIFEYLARRQQILCITLLFACSRDEEGSVRGAAVRALGICLLYPSLSEDYGFIVDTAETIYRILQDDSFTVKMKASWSLGNLSETLVANKLNKNANTNNGGEELSNVWILKLLKTTNKTANDSDKIRMNLVRALGNILQLITNALIEKDPEFKLEVKKAIDILIRNCSTGSNMKVRWNSCYALGNAMKNSILFDKSFDNWEEKAFKALSDLAINFRNFKVRINATVALSSPGKRTYYGQHYQLVWNSLCKALDTAQNMEDFSEYKHRDHLIEQICLTLGHLTTILTVEDLNIIHDCITLYLDNLKRQMQKVWDRLLPEKSTVLFEARSHLNRLSTKKNLRDDQKTTIQLLQDIIRQNF